MHFRRDPRGRIFCFARKSEELHEIRPAAKDEKDGNSDDGETRSSQGRLSHPTTIPRPWAHPTDVDICNASIRGAVEPAAGRISATLSTSHHTQAHTPGIAPRVSAEGSKRIRAAQILVLRLTNPCLDFISHRVYHFGL